MFGIYCSNDEGDIYYDGDYGDLMDFNLVAEI